MQVGDIVKVLRTEEKKIVVGLRTEIVPISGDWSRTDEMRMRRVRRLSGDVGSRGERGGGDSFDIDASAEARQCARPRGHGEAACEGGSSDEVLTTCNYKNYARDLRRTRDECMRTRASVPSGFRPTDRRTREDVVVTDASSVTAGGRLSPSPARRRNIRLPDRSTERAVGCP